MLLSFAVCWEKNAEVKSVGGSKSLLTLLRVEVKERRSVENGGPNRF